MGARFILRFDDITPGMAWSKFVEFDHLCKKLDLPALVGVVPDCRDPKLEVEPARADFWDIVRDWSARGWAIAQHGYTHEYVTKDAGVLAISSKSEFAGLSYEDQFKKLSAGKAILERENVWQPTFMAPSHAFDATTVQALDALGFITLTDGYGVYPYRIGRLMAVPQLFSSPNHLGFGVYTLCLHVNQMPVSHIKKVLEYIRSHRNRFISFDEAIDLRCSIPGVAPMMRLATCTTLRMIRTLRR